MPLLAICAICSETFEARTSYGLCPSCYSRDRIREWDRLQTALQRVHKAGLPASLTLPQWLSVVSDCSGLCAWCQEMTYSFIELIDTSDGLIDGNAVPACKACVHHRKYGFMAAEQRVRRLLQRGSQNALPSKSP